MFERVFSPAMSTPAIKRIGRLAGGVLALFLVALLSASGQGMQSVIHSRSRLFPSLGPGIAGLKRDAAGHYYILADPASTILIFDSSGRRLGQIPNANSGGTTIRYAVSIDLDPNGLLYVADRGDNAVKVFASNGALIANVPVTAPTSVVALSDGQFAVTKLQSKRLVEIMGQKGATIRTFGDPVDESGSLIAVHSATSTQPVPVVDRGRITGDSSGNIYFAFIAVDDPMIQRFDRYGYSAYDTVMSAADFGALPGHSGRDIQVGYTMSGLTGPTTVTGWTDLRSGQTSVSEGSHGRRGQGGGAGSSATGAGSANGSTAGASATDSSASAIPGDSSDLEGAILSFDAQGTSDSSTLLGPGLGVPGLLTPGMMGMGLGDPFHFGGMHPGGGFGNFGGGEPRWEGAEGFGHFHPGGYGTYRASATLRVSLDDPSKHKLEMPVITAVGIDAKTQEAWVAIGDILARLDNNGNLVDTYYVTITGDTTIKPTAILVEPDRILIASDPWGVYEFARPDKPSAPLPAPQGTAVPQQVAPTAR
jgi:hypothetical protein